MAGLIRIKLVRSTISAPEKHKTIVRSLGLRKLNQVVERPDSPGFRGMVKKIPHLLALEETGSGLPQHGFRRPENQHPVARLKGNEQ